MRKTFDDYIKAVKLKYDVEKEGKHAGFLLLPSPAQLRNLCLLVYDNGLNRNDENQFRNFFQPRENEDLRKCISNFDTEKFKAIGHFLKGKSESTNLTNLELIAVLLNYSPRPLPFFLKYENNQGDEKSAPAPEPNLFSKESIGPKTRHNKKAVFGVILISLLSAGYIAKDLCFPKKECMQWQDDHYEVVDCENDELSNLVLYELKPLDKSLLKFRKINVTRDTVFFKYGKPLYYYSKQNKKVEFFNAPGLHPVTGKPLKEVTRHIINEHVK